MEIEQDIEAFAEKVGVEIETLADEGYQAFVLATKPLYDDLLAYAKNTDKADIGVLLTDLKQDLITGVTTLATTGSNAGAAIAATASQTLSQVPQITAAAKNALYGALAIVATDVPETVGASSTSSAAAGTASATTAQPS